jgi:hypothetical protein
MSIFSESVSEYVEKIDIKIILPTVTIEPGQHTCLHGS